MMKRVAGAGLCLSFLAFAAPAQALEGCTCAGMALNGAKVLGTVDAASGAVTLDGAKAQAGMVLKNGSTIATGKEASANLSVSGCSVPMTATSSVSISQTGPDVCVKLVENGKFVSPERFAGVLPGEQEGSTTQQISREEAERRFGRLPEFVIAGTFSIVAGGLVWFANEDADPVCVSRCG